MSNDSEKYEKQDDLLNEEIRRSNFKLFEKTYFRKTNHVFEHK